MQDLDNHIEDFLKHLLEEIQEMSTLDFSTIVSKLRITHHSTCNPNPNHNNTLSPYLFIYSNSIIPQLP